MPSFKIAEHHMLNSINLKPHPQARPMHAEKIEMGLGTKLVGIVYRRLCLVCTVTLIAICCS